MWYKVMTGFGYWDVYAWLIFLAIASFFTLWLRGLGRDDYKEGTYQDEIYFSGNDVPEDGEGITVPADSAYWGFKKALAPYYKILVSMHSGHVIDYVGYLVLVTGIVTALIVLV